MGLDQTAKLQSRTVDWKKYYSQDRKESEKEQAGVFVWRKHARLQVFMAREYAKQNPKENTNEHSGNIDGLGFNGDDHKVVITKDVLKRLEEAIKNDYWDYFATDGFFWGQQYQEEQVKGYKKMDLQFLKFCKEALEKGEVIEYSCSW
tara:strand:+ start:498 stop:941 length:444 start_codon:yes stop_codon:yes gene_type:complete